MSNTSESNTDTNSPSSGPTAPVPKDPQPTVDRIEELARRILTGDIMLPKFQRDFVWKRDQVLTLLDSIVRNYPIGSVLLWQSRQELRSENRIADLEINLPRPDYPVNYLLDGQQRLSSVCGSLYWSGTDPQSVWNIAYDLRSQEFIHLDSLDDPPQHQVRMNRLSDPSQFYRHVASLDSLDASDKDILKENADKLFNRLKDYKIAVVTLGDMSIQDVAPIFERINSTGTRLTIVDLMRAATWSEDFDLIDAIDEVRDVLSNKKFGDLDRKVLLRTISAAAGGGFSVSSIDGLRAHEPDALKSAVASTEEAYRRAVDFLVTQIKIPTDAVVPYANQIVVLAELFRLLPSPSAEQYQEVRKWFWRTAASGYFGGWNTGNMASDQEAIGKFARGEASLIDVNVVPPRPEIWTSRTFRSDGAHAKTLALILSYRGPKDLLTGQHIDVAQSLAWTNAKEFHHFFPKDYLKSRSISSRKANCLANIVMLSSASNKTISNRAPSDYLTAVEAAAGSNLSDWLDSNLIPLDAYEAARRDDFDGFLIARRTAIQDAVANFADW